MTARYIWYARGKDAFSDPKQAKRCLPVLGFLRGSLWPGKEELPPGLVEVLHADHGDGGVYMPALVGPSDYEKWLAFLWKHEANGARGDGMDLIINEQDVLPRAYAQYAELFQCDLSEVCGFAYEMHCRTVGNPAPNRATCSFGACEPTAPFYKDGRDIEPPASWATQAGMGLLRIKGTAMGRKKPGWASEPGDDWRTLDSRFATWLYREFGPIHVHWDPGSPTRMIEHRHGLCVGDI